VVGQERDDARSRLERVDLAVDVTEQESSQEPGTVISQDPPAGTKVAKGDTISLTVAKEPSEAEVPDVRGAAVNDALDALSDAGFRPRQRTVLVDTADEDGFVIDQDPKPGERRKKGSRVTIQVGRFDDSQLDPEGGSTPTPEPTPTPTP
jgi:eukaryotic-like serine/threonine-protein kinase